MKILFLYPAPRESEQVYTGFHQGLGVLSALAQTKGHQTRLLVASEFDPVVVEQQVNNFKPDLVAATAATSQFPLVRRIINHIHATFSIPALVGGIHATVAPEESLAPEGVLGICRGEGEQGFQCILDQLEKGEDITGAPNFWFKGPEGIIKNPPAEPTDLEGLPFADREIFGFQAMLDRFGKIMGAEFIGSRGCPFHCTYCANQYLNQLYHNRYYRRRRVDRLLKEIEQVRKRYDFSVVGFHDDIFALDAAWLEEFSKKYPKKFDMPFWCNARVDCLDEERIRLLKKSRCYRVHVGIESGNEQLRARVLKRGFSNQQIVEIFELIRKHKMRTLAFNMIGIPFETEENVRETIELNRRIRPDRIHLTIFYPYPGTELGQVCRDNGWVPGTGSDNFYDPENGLNQPSLPPILLKKYQAAFIPQVYA